MAETEEVPSEAKIAVHPGDCKERSDIALKNLDVQVKATPEASSVATIATPLIRLHYRQEANVGGQKEIRLKWAQQLVIYPELLHLKN